MCFMKTYQSYEMYRMQTLRKTEMQNLRIISIFPEFITNIYVRVIYQVVTGKKNIKMIQ